MSGKVFRVQLKFFQGHVHALEVLVTWLYICEFSSRRWMLRDQKLELFCKTSSFNLVPRLQGLTSMKLNVSYSELSQCCSRSYYLRLDWKRRLVQLLGRLVGTSSLGLWNEGVTGGRGGPPLPTTLHFHSHDPQIALDGAD